MARKAKPVALKVVEGRGGDRDSGGRKIPETPDFKKTTPDKPEDLSELASAMWDRLIDELTRLDIVREIDGGALHGLCESYARWLTAVHMRQEHGLLATTSQGLGVAPWVRVEESAGKEYRSWCAEFGLTPATETKISGKARDDDGDENPFAASG